MALRCQPTVVYLNIQCLWTFCACGWLCLFVRLALSRLPPGLLRLKLLICLLEYRPPCTHSLRAIELTLLVLQCLVPLRLRCEHILAFVSTQHIGFSASVPVKFRSTIEQSVTLFAACCVSRWPLYCMLSTNGRQKLTG